MIDLRVVVASTNLDKEQVRDLRRSVLCGELNWPRESVEDPSDDRSVLLLASLGPKPVGCVRLQQEGHTFHIEVLAVLERFRKQGIGRRLVLELEKKAQEMGATAMAVLAPLSIAPFFEHLGYQSIPTADGFCRLGKSFH
jgi:ribosomal protein S18 acetylase RimI-like enzyme